MIENRNQILRLPNGFHNTTVYWGKQGWLNRSLKGFYFFEALLDHFEAIFLRLQYNTISQTLITPRAVHLRFNIVK